jgi:hypothetical protein
MISSKASTVGRCNLRVRFHETYCGFVPTMQDNATFGIGDGEEGCR